MQQRIISLVINGDALGKCYRAIALSPCLSITRPPSGLLSLSHSLSYTCHSFLSPPYFFLSSYFFLYAKRGLHYSSPSSFYTWPPSLKAPRAKLKACLSLLVFFSYTLSLLLYLLLLFFSTLSVKYFTAKNFNCNRQEALSICIYIAPRTSQFT